MKKKKLLIILSCMCMALSMTACKSELVNDILGVDEFKEFYDKNISEDTTPTITEETHDHVVEKDNYIITFHYEKTVSTSDITDYLLYYNWTDEFDNTVTKISMSYNLVEGRVDRDFPSYNDLETIVINDKEFKYGKGEYGDDYLFYMYDYHAYLKIKLSYIGTYDAETNQTVEDKPISIEMFNNENFAEYTNFEIERKEGAIIDPEEVKVVVIEPETIDVVDYTENEKKAIVKLVYADKIAEILLTKVNECGIHNIQNSYLEPSESGYIFKLVTKNKETYLVTMDGAMDVMSIQRDSLDGEYVYKVEIQMK